LLRVEDRVQIVVGHELRDRQPQLVAVQHPVFVGLAVHAVDDGDLLFERGLHGGGFRGDELGEALTGASEGSVAK
jgi:hypothetical protein